MKVLGLWLIVIALYLIVFYLFKSYQLDVLYYIDNECTVEYEEIVPRQLL